ncbi:sulfotransferase family 2 domain-containing protein [Planctomycetota bacterium]
MITVRPRNRVKRFLRRAIAVGTARRIHSAQIIALHDYRAIYFPIPKVANTSLKAVCSDLLGDTVDEKFLQPGWKQSAFRIPDSIRDLQKKGVIIDRYDLQDYGDYWKFAFVRNPWDRLVSCYKQKIREPGYNYKSFKDGVAGSLLKHKVFRGGMSFSDFVDEVAKISDEIADKHFRSQHTFITDKNKSFLVDYIGHLEDIDEGFRFVCRKIGATEVELPHLLKTDRKPYQEYYDDETKSTVHMRYATDIEMFGYVF